MIFLDFLWFWLIFHWYLLFFLKRSIIFVDFLWFWSIFFDFDWFFIDFIVLRGIFNSFPWFSLILLLFLKCSIVFLDFLWFWLLFFDFSMGFMLFLKCSIVFLDFLWFFFFLFFLIFFGVPRFVLIFLDFKISVIFRSVQFLFFFFGEISEFLRKYWKTRGFYHVLSFFIIILLRFNIILSFFDHFFAVSFFYHFLFVVSFFHFFYHFFCGIIFLYHLSQKSIKIKENQGKLLNILRKS